MKALILIQVLVSWGIIGFGVYRAVKILTGNRPFKILIAFGTVFAFLGAAATLHIIFVLAMAWSRGRM